MIETNREMGEHVIAEGGVEYKLEENEVEGLQESNCERGTKDQPTNMEEHLAVAGSIEELGMHAGGSDTNLEEETKVNDEDPLAGHLFWQLLLQAGYTRW